MTEFYVCRAAACDLELPVNPADPDETHDELADHTLQQHTDGDRPAAAALLSHPYREVR